MKKTIFLSILAALLLCAVLCTAGCVDAPTDPIVGTYVTETDSSVSYAVFENGGTGYFAEAAETDDAAGLAAVTCSWAAADSKNTYTLTFADGRAETAVLDAEHGLMTIGEVEYQKYPSELSGGALAAVYGARAKEALLESAGESAVPMSTEEQIGWAPSAVGVSSPVQLPWGSSVLT